MVDARRNIQGRVDDQRTPGAGRLRPRERERCEALALLVPRIFRAPHIERLAAAHHVAVLAQALHSGFDLHPVPGPRRLRRRALELYAPACAFSRVDGVPRKTS